jgi:hypothetical protein
MCSSSIGRTAALVLLLALAAAGARAQTSPGAGADGRPWLLVLSALRDEDDYEHGLASFHLGLREATWLSLTAGSSRAPSTESEVRANLAAIGIEHDFGPVGFSLTFEDWGDEDNLESRDWQAEVFVSGEDYRLAFARERRAIDIFFSGPGAPLGTDLRRIRVDADGIGLNGRYRISPEWQIYGAFMDYDYPRRIRVVPRADRLNLLSTSAVTLAYSFVDVFTSVGVERAFGPTLLNVDLGRDRSTIDDELLDSLSVSLLWPVAARFDLEFTLGRSRSSSYGSSVYGGLSVYVYGG